MANILRLGNGTNPFKGYKLVTGSKTMSTVNNDPNIIPFACKVSMSQVAGTSWGYVKYNGKNICSFRQYEGTGSLSVFMGDDALNLIKGQIAVTNCTVTAVTVRNFLCFARKPLCRKA